MDYAGRKDSFKVTLREFTIEDIDFFHQLESNPIVVRFQTWPPRSRAESQKLVEQIITNQTTRPRNHVEFVAELVPNNNTDPPKEAGVVQTPTPAVQPIGRVGCWITDNVANLWFSFLPESQGKGFATQATQKLLDYLLQHRSSTSGEIAPWKVLQIECDPRNIGSWKIAERLGFEKVKEERNVYECKGEWVDSVLYERDV